MKKDPRVLLGLQSLAFSMKGLNVTAAERRALYEVASSAALDRMELSSAYLLLRRAAVEAADTDPLTEECAGRLRAALAAFEAASGEGEGKPRHFWEKGQYA